MLAKHLSLIVNYDYSSMLSYQLSVSVNRVLACTSTLLSAALRRHQCTGMLHSVRTRVHSNLAAVEPAVHANFTEQATLITLCTEDV